MNLSFLYSNNPIYKRRIKIMQEKLRNKNMSIFCSSCIGGIIYHNLGLKFFSPTINTMMFQTDMYRFILDPKRYLSKEIEFLNNEKIPVGMIDDIKVHFTHYSTNGQAREKWVERSKRINFDNIFVMMSDRDGLTYEQMKRIGELKYRGIVIFTSKEYKDLPHTFYIDKYKNKPYVGNILQRNKLLNKRLFESYFDYVSWFNNESGKYNCEKYRIK